MAKWSFLTNHARALLCIAHNPGVRLRDIASTLDITERSAYAIVTELADAGYVVKEKDGRRNRYEIQRHLPLRGTIGRERSIGEVLDVLVEATARRPSPPTRQPQSPSARPWWRWVAQT
jgi:DNA-binding IclR family transcriptional regulator